MAAAEALKQLGVDDAERIVIGIGSNLGASLLTASAVMDLGVKNVWAKADNDRHAKILNQIGVHHVVRPERDTGRRVAHLIGRQVSDMPAGIVIVAVRQLEGRFATPEPTYLLQSGDLVIAAGTAKGLDEFSEVN